jgi:hypothetical protein
LTYGIAFSTPFYAGIITDRRLSGGRRTDDSLKCGVVLYVDAVLGYSFSGLAAYRSFETRFWLAEALCDAGRPGVGIETALQRLAETATQQIRELGIASAADRRLSIVFAGYRISPFGIRVPVLYLVSNYEEFSSPASDVAWSEFRVSIHDVRPNSLTVTSIGSTAPTRESLDPLIQLSLNPNVPPQEAVNAAVNIIREAAGADRTGSVGKRCSSIILPNASSGAVLLDYHPDRPATRSYVPAFVCAIYGNSGAYYKVDESLRGATPDGSPAVLRVPRVRRNSPCPCGSSRPYRKCHGSKDAGPLKLSHARVTIYFMYKALPEDGSDIIISSMD